MGKAPDTALLCYSWSDLSVTTGLTDEQVTGRSQSTVLFTLMAQLAQHPSGADLLLPPSAAEQVPTLDQIAARWPQYSQQEVDQLRLEYEQEAGTLIQYLEACRLEDVFEEYRSQLF